MLAAYRQKVGVYDFVGAHDAIAKAQFSEPSLKESQENLAKKAQWLVDWKAHFIEDLNRVGFSGAISDIGGLQYHRYPACFSLASQCEVALRRYRTRLGKIFAEDAAGDREHFAQESAARRGCRSRLVIRCVCQRNRPTGAGTFPRESSG